MKLRDRILTNLISRFLPSSLLWKVDTTEKEVYLTFDDGPIPGLTPEILGILKHYGAKATFFCVGENVVRHPGIFREIVDAGHAVGNHSNHHVKGWSTCYKAYLADVAEASKYVDSKLYRPPYGLITPKQARALSASYRVVMWSVLTRDFDQAVSREECLDIAVNGVRPGAIFVFHDNLKASEKVLFTLPRLLEYLKKEDYRTGLIHA